MVIYNEFLGNARLDFRQKVEKTIVSEKSVAFNDTVFEKTDSMGRKMDENSNFFYCSGWKKIKKTYTN